MCLLAKAHPGKDPVEATNRRARRPAGGGGPGGAAGPAPEAGARPSHDSDGGDAARSCEGEARGAQAVGREGLWGQRRRGPNL